jgi:hypothetical protein
MANLMPNEITNDVRQVLSSASRGKGNRPNFLTAYQILDRLPAPIQQRLIAERTLGGTGAGVSYAAPSVVSDAAEMLQDIDIDYMDSQGVMVTVAGQAVEPSNVVCGLYRLK